MAVDIGKKLFDAQSLLESGKVNEANELIKSLHWDLSVEAAAAGQAPPPPPRSIGAIALDFARHLVEHLGAPPVLQKDYDELMAAYQSQIAGAAAKE